MLIEWMLLIQCGVIRGAAKTKTFNNFSGHCLRLKFITKTFRSSGLKKEKEDTANLEITFYLFVC